MIAKNNRIALDKLKVEYGKLSQDKRSLAVKLLENYYNGEVKYREKYDGSFKIVRNDEIVGVMEKVVEDYLKSEDYFIEKLAKLCGEVEKIKPFARGDKDSLMVIVNRQLKNEDLPPIEKWSGMDAVYYKKALRKYRYYGEIADLEMVLYLAVKEALVRWIAILGGKKTVPLARYAQMQGESVNAVRNKARRQTIPAFRKDGKWVVVI